LGYNLALGGGGSRGYRHSAEAIEKIRKSSKERLPSAKCKEMARMAKLGKKRPDFSRFMSTFNTGRKQSEVTIQKRAEALRGRSRPAFSDETKARMSLARKAWWDKRQQGVNYA